MHVYATDSPERRNITVYLAVMSIFIAIGLSKLPPLMGYVIPWWLDYPSVMGVFGILYGLFNGTIWKYNIFRRIDLIKVPNLSGKWEGTLLTSYDNHEQRHNVNVVIEQNWTEMCISLRADHSESNSQASSLLVRQNNVPLLIYNYFDEPRGTATESMHSHRGTGVLKLIASDELDGQYYTGRDRLTYGVLRLKKV